MEKMVARVGNKKGTTMAEASWIQDDEDDLSTWEIINPYADDDGEEEDEEEENEAFFYDEDGDIFVIEYLPSDLDNQPSPHGHVDEDDAGVLDLKDSPIDERRGYDDDKEEEEEEEVDHGYVDYDDDDDDDDGGYEYDLDDNLVPKSVSNRFGGQRMKKLGKRASPKMNNSKKLPYYYFNRPGFVHGKN